jgi:hypothetical protein
MSPLIAMKKWSDKKDGNSLLIMSLLIAMKKWSDKKGGNSLL